MEKTDRGWKRRTHDEEDRKSDGIDGQTMENRKNDVREQRRFWHAKLPKSSYWKLNDSRKITKKWPIVQNTSAKIHALFFQALVIFTDKNKSDSLFMQSQSIALLVRTRVNTLTP